MNDGPQVIVWCGVLSFVTGYVASRYPNSRTLHLLVLVTAAALALLLILVKLR
jgi:hypothetical protein